MVAYLQSPGCSGKKKKQPKPNQCTSLYSKKVHCHCMLDFGAIPVNRSSEMTKRVSKDIQICCAAVELFQHENSSNGNGNGNDNKDNKNKTPPSCDDIHKTRTYHSFFMHLKCALNAVELGYDLGWCLAQQ